MHALYCFPNQTLYSFGERKKKKQGKVALQFRHGQGVGDAIMFSSYIKNFCRLNPGEIFVNITDKLGEIMDPLYADCDNLIVSNVIDPDIKLRDLCFKDVVNHFSWRYLDYPRRLELEVKLYTWFCKNFGSQYIILHERSRDNCDRNMPLIRKNLIYNPNNYPIINLDYDSMKKHGLSIKHNLLDLRLIIENANQLHLYEGSIANFADSIMLKAQIKTIHLYCKPHLFDPKMVHYDVVRYIRQGLWYKKNWQIFYK